MGFLHFFGAQLIGGGRRKPATDSLESQGLGLSYLLVVRDVEKWGTKLQKRIS